MLAETLGLRVFAKEIPGVFTRRHEEGPPTEGIEYRKREESDELKSQGRE